MCSGFVRVACVFLIALAITTIQTNAGEAHRQTILFLADEGPLVIEFQITVDEKPFTDIWQAELAKLVKELDRNENGTLSRDETEIPTNKENSKTPKPSRQSEELTRVANLWDADAEPRDDQLSLQELSRFLARMGEGPFQTEASKKTAALTSPQVTLTNNAGERLWGWLDNNKDSKLSSEELAGAGAMLRKRDLDADESISLNEVQAITNPFFNARRSNQKTDTPFFVIHQNQSTTPLIRRLIQRYGKKKSIPSPTPANDPPKKQSNKDRKPPKPVGLRVDLWKLSKNQRDEFDRDGNGILDFWELRTYLRSPVPMVTIQVGLPSSEKAELQLTGSVSDGKLPVTVKTSVRGSVSILAGEIQIEIDTTGLRPETLLQSLEERFKLRDADNNGYLEQKEANRDLFFRQHFKKYDADGDEKLYPKEWKPPVTAAIHTARTRTRMEVQNGGKDVFSVLDIDRNLEISPREWLTAADRLSVWDKNESGTLEKSEIPQVYRLSFGRGLPELPGLVPSQNNNAQTITLQKLVRGPKWFQAMDKNGDGDVSAREFLGKRDVFRQIDLDKNRLIDPREATKFAK